VRGLERGSSFQRGPGGIQFFIKEYIWGEGDSTLKFSARSPEEKYEPKNNKGRKKKGCGGGAAAWARIFAGLQTPKAFQWGATYTAKKTPRKSDSQNNHKELWKEE